MKFIRKTASEKCVNILSVAEPRQTAPLSLTDAAIDFGVDADECVVEKHEGKRRPAPTKESIEVPEEETLTIEKKEEEGVVEGAIIPSTAETKQLKSYQMESAFADAEAVDAAAKEFVAPKAEAAKSIKMEAMIGMTSDADQSTTMMKGVVEGEVATPAAKMTRMSTATPKEIKTTTAAPKTTTTTPTNEGMPLESRPSRESFASRASDSSFCSMTTRETRKQNFFQVLATKEFQILSRRSKYGLTEAEKGAPDGKLVFVDEGIGEAG